MSARNAAYIDAIDHLPDDATLLIQNVSWDDYEQLLADVGERAGLRIAYDDGELEIMTLSPEHEDYQSVIYGVVMILAEELNLKVQNYGSATWNVRLLGKGVEADGCYYVANADRVIGKRKFDLETDPPPDIVAEVDITSGSLNKFRIYAAFSVPEIWRYHRGTMHFFELAENDYREVKESRFFSGLTPSLLAGVLEESRQIGQTDALRAFRQRLKTARP